ncbi:hypothetical protein HBH70_227910 [Parastagonospora nodorum]|nr:hypothetical protein HBH52_239180 [Parastagonospora nodorum]KAH4072940.1 hypothetical protein HBH50_047240 [Parastagonospora nodorum]KAH4100004.1 hypothetical protein HBH48_014770 [Parastagonospora nodorum]KAH4109174.1 hypothetical protein HBH46_032870 [Parastagonospora nodorum]KAH4113002.1 hypothetical protein HBH47_216710 [Parastagonospora nodorum]
MSHGWDPTEVLQLCNDRRCIGYAPSQRRKCRNIIAKANVQRFQRLLIELAEQEPDPDFLEPRLREIASYGLCVAYHRSQADDMVRKWSAMMLEAYPPTPVAPAPVRYQRSAASSYPRVCVSPGTTSRRSTSTSSSTSSYISPLEDAELRALREHASRLEDIGRRRMRQESVLYEAQTRAGTVSTSRSSVSSMSTIQISRRAMEDASNTLPARSTARAPTPIRLPAAASDTTSEPSTPRPTSRVPTSVRLPAAASDITSEPSTPPSTSRAPTPVRLPAAASSEPSTPPSTSVARSTALSTSAPPTRSSSTQGRHCERTHVRRLPIDEECPICYDDTPLSSCAPGEVVWCRSSCGRSVHASCFEDWRAQCADRTLTCMVCRESWDEECECESCTVAHVQKRDVVQEACSICREDLRPDRDEEQYPALSWCKSGCGRSVHQECFDGWRAACLGRGTNATCTDCRAVWVDECGC